MTKKLNLVAICLAAIGVVDVVLRWYLCGSEAFLYSLHDPGKILFHIFILPYAYILFVRKFSFKERWGDFKKLPGNRKRYFVVFTVSLLVVGLWLAIDHENSTRCRKDYKDHSFIMPFDVTNADTIRLMMTIRSEIFVAIKTLRDTQDSISDAKDEGNVADAKRLEASLPMISVKKERLKKQYGDLAYPKNSEGCTIMQVGSVSSKWGLFETIIGVVFVWMLLSGMIFLVVAKVLTTEVIEGLIMVGAVLCPWIFLRIYSETYINFGKLNAGVLAGVFLFICVLVVFSIVAIVHQNPNLQQKKKFGVIWSVATTVYSIVTAFNSTVLDYTFAFVNGIHWPGTVFIFLILTIPFVFLFEET